MKQTLTHPAVLLLASCLLLNGCDKQAEEKPSAPAAAPVASSTNGDAAAKAVINHYADIALATFSDSLSEALKLQAAVDAFVKNPDTAHLQAARAAWIAARIPYMQTEAFRFGNKVVDDWEGQVNAWPLDEGLIDYVAADYQHALGNPGATANIVANTALTVGEQKLDFTRITPELLASLNELGGSEANVATGYHAIEFLLWGQDLNGTNAGAGNRPASDYAVGKDCTGGHCERRAEYLTTVTALLVSDLQSMVAEWQPNAENSGKENYRAQLQKEPVAQGLRTIVVGLGSLSLGELAGQRMQVALEANSTEDEHDCFSDNTHASHFYDGKGISNIYLGEYVRTDGSIVRGPGLSSLVAAKNPAADTEVKNKLASTEKQLQALVDSANNGQHFDQMIAAGNTAGNALVKNSIDALTAQTTAIETAAAVLGITDLKSAGE
ncbi:MAG TPA: imelysin family protein [Pseudomonadales bacterium]|nr:imelysin family protein [Pseudomonadales bacterium]